MTDTTSRLPAGDVLVCHLVASSSSRIDSARDRQHHVDSLEAVSMPVLRRWDRSRRAQGRPPTFEDLLEAYWVGFGCLRWLLDVARLRSCDGCGEWVTEKELESHARRCGIVTETHETRVPDPPEEIYLCPDEECGFWSTEYTNIRAPHPSRAHQGLHSSHSFILEDDADKILELWMRRHPPRVLEVDRCRLCQATLSSRRAFMDHFVKHHVTNYTSDDVWQKIMTGADFLGRKKLSQFISRTLAECDMRELVVIFSPAVHRTYRERIISGILPIQAAGGMTQREEWSSIVLDLIDSYFRMQVASDTAVNISISPRSLPAQRISGGRQQGSAHPGAYRSVRIWVPGLLRLFLGK